LYAEVLDEGYVRERLELVAAAIDRFLVSDGRSVRVGAEVVSEADLRAVRDALSLRLRRQPEEASDPAAAPSAYLPRDPIISCVQSGLQDAGDQRVGASIGLQGLRTTMALDEPRDLVAEAGEPRDELPPVTDQHLPVASPRTLEERLAFDPGSFDPFPSDPIWAAAIAAALGYRLIRGQHPFNPKPAIAQLGEGPRLFLFSDWGTGIPRAVALSKHVRDRLKDNPDGRGQHVAHLGDVYYAGWPHEQRRHVLEAWPVPPEQPDLAHSWALNGNHDMYSGGYGYFETVLGAQRFAKQRSPDGRPTSIFELSNKHWRVIGLDTAWHDHDLVDPQIHWLKSRILAAEKAAQSVILLSHHQLFTTFGHLDGPQLFDKLSPFLKHHRVRAWFWGHEHRCTLYTPTDEVEHPRCIGNGGVPAYVTGPDADHDPSRVQLDYEGVFGPADDGHQWRNFAYVQLEFDEDKATATYFDEKDQEFHSEPL
jgi:hypothetical protein